MLKFRWLSISLIVISVIILSCRKPVPEIRGLDKSRWVKDKNGCLRQRKSMMEAIKTQKEKFLSLSEVEIMGLLGRPDENELYKRNQKFYYYNILPSRSCTGREDSITARLIIRFNAMGLAKEVTIEP